MATADVACGDSLCHVAGVRMNHGHVTPNANGSKARCGGPGICPECSLEKAQLEGAYLGSIPIYQPKRESDQSSWEKHLPSPKKRKPAEGFMIRPPQDVTDWLNKKAADFKLSGNKIIVAILTEAMNKDAK